VSLPSDGAPDRRGPGSAPPAPVLIVGLGNPGPAYAGTRHNAGFMAAERLVDRLGLPAFRRAHRGRFTRGAGDGADVAVLLPETLMNRSGESVAEALRVVPVALDRVVVVHDELDLALEDVRPKLGGGLAGHRGLRSIVAHVGDPGFRRVRIGIGRPPEGTSVRDWVLGPFSDAETEALDVALDRAVDLVRDALRSAVEPGA